jgi:hypothetical protein
MEKILEKRKGIFYRSYQWWTRSEKGSMSEQFRGKGFD